VKCKDCATPIPSKGPRRCMDCLAADPSKNSRGRAGARWAKVRLEVLERDGYLCQIRIAGCTRRATQVDHIVPLTTLGPDDPRRDDPAALRAACRNCNTRRRYYEEPTRNSGEPDGTPDVSEVERYTPSMPADHRPNHDAPHGKYLRCTSPDCDLHYWIRSEAVDEWQAKSRAW
jgi:5-methylcytosine-specific restriction endonuclease McrA